MTNSILPYDTETTGLIRNKSYDDPEQPHLVQLAALQVTTKPLRIHQSMSLLVRPDGWEIPSYVTDIHGITTEEALARGAPEKTVLDIFLSLWSGEGDSPLLRVAHNANFDKEVIAVAIARHYGRGELLDLWLESPDYCTMQEAKLVVKALNKRGSIKLPKLAEVYEFFFESSFDNAHSANADVVATMEIFFALQQEESPA